MLGTVKNLIFELKKALYKPVSDEHRINNFSPSAENNPEMMYPGNRDYIRKNNSLMISHFKKLIIPLVTREIEKDER